MRWGPGPARWVAAVGVLLLVVGPVIDRGWLAVVGIVVVAVAALYAVTTRAK